MQTHDCVQKHLPFRGKPEPNSAWGPVTESLVCEKDILDCSGETRLALCIPAYHEPESVNIVCYCYYDYYYHYHYHLSL